MRQEAFAPSSDDLHAVLSQVLESFAYALPVPAAAGDGRPLELCVRGELPEGQGWLVLRGSAGLAGRLAADAAGESEDSDAALAQDAFAELCNLCVSHLVSRLWGGQQRSFKPFVPSAGLPSGECGSQILLDVDGEPLEASYWRAA